MNSCNGFHLLVYGQVKLAIGSSQGAEKVIEIPGQGQVFGEAAMFLDRCYTVTAQTLEDSVTQVIEQKMTGLDNLLYMSSASDSYGSASVTLTFDAGTNPDIAQVQVQNKLQLALPSLPQIVQTQGVQVAKSQRCGNLTS